MKPKLQIIAITSLLLISCSNKAEDECPFPSKYIEIDRSYHQCINGEVRNGASCDYFINTISTLFYKYNCTRSFDTGPVPAIWLFDSASENYIKLIYEMAAGGHPIYGSDWFKKESAKAKEIFLSEEFKSILDGHMAEEYYPLIEKVKNAL